MNRVWIGLVALVAIASTGCGVETNGEPCVCPEVYAPVCGVDGVTYDNDCFAECEGVEIAHVGECEQGCYRDEDCDEGEHCEFVPDPVPLDERVAKRTIAPRGVCVPDVLSCEEHDDCPSGYYCAKPYFDPLEDRAQDPPVPIAEGMCRDLCEIIDLDCGPGYQCLHGGCVPITERCNDNADCGRELICYPPTKTCEPRCAVDCLVPNPVCGEDGVTYYCGTVDAYCNGVEVAHEGECGGDCRETGCSEGWTCDLCREGWVCLSPNAGACEPPGDCRANGCDDEDECIPCWSGYICASPGTIC